jgi:hypothetical protein
MDNISVEVRGHFSRDELARLDDCTLTLGTSKLVTIIDLIVGWATHVDKIDCDRIESLDNPKTWGPYDLLAAMSIRTFLQGCVDRVPAPLRAKVVAVIDRHDGHFWAITQPDIEHLVSKFEDTDVDQKPWWWHRVPDSGPMLEELRA